MKAKKMNVNKSRSPISVVELHKVLLIFLMALYGGPESQNVELHKTQQHFTKHNDILQNITFHKTKKVGTIILVCAWTERTQANRVRSVIAYYGFCYWALVFTEKAIKRTWLQGKLKQGFPDHSLQTKIFSTGP